ncbi:MAG: type II secretion system F family protein, partial [Myxococcota bacterium]|nr:type II secretion system F family protein [Myxococcota bacterium]
EDDAVSEPPDRSTAGVRLGGQTRVWWSVALGSGVFLVCALFWDWYLAAGIGMVAGALAHVSFTALEKKRTLQLEEGLAEAIALASSALRAGASPVDALERAARAVKGPAQPVLLDLSGALRLGDDVERALEGLVNRVPLESYRLFAVALAVQWRAGGSLERSLAVVARAVRDRVELERRIFSQAAPTRVSVFAFVLATLAIAYLMWQNDPANVEHFLTSSTGVKLVGTSIWLQAIGILWMSQMSRIRV